MIQSNPRPGDDSVAMLEQEPGWEFGHQFDTEVSATDECHGIFSGHRDKDLGLTSHGKNCDRTLTGQSPRLLSLSWGVGDIT